MIYFRIYIRVSIGRGVGPQPKGEGTPTPKNHARKGLKLKIFDAKGAKILKKIKGFHEKSVILLGVLEEHFANFG